MKSRWVPAATAFLATAFYLGCAAVPEIRFVDEDASAPDGGARDGGPGTDGGGVVRDGAVDAGDASLLCTTASPGASAVCCGTVWCLDDCGPQNCDECAKKGCAAGEVCCGKTGTVVCKSRCP